MDYMVRVIRSGRVEEKICFPVNQGTKTRKPKSRGSLPRKQDSNERDGIKRTARVINCNYDAGDLLITLTYSDETIAKLGKEDPDELHDAADREAVKFLRRLGYHMKKGGVEPVTMLFTSDTDGETGELVRVHHHLLIKCDGFELRKGKLLVCGKELEKIWKLGGVEYESLHAQDSYSKLAAYLYRQVRRIYDGENKYHGSSNLKKPQLISERIVHSNRRLRLPKGAKIIQRVDKDYLPDGTQYLAYIIADRPRVKRGIKKTE